MGPDRAILSLPTGNVTGASGNVTGSEIQLSSIYLLRHTGKPSSFEARSTDDGSTWKNVNISTTTWNPDLGFFKSGAFIGDYSGIAANDSVTYPTWTDGRHSNIANTGIGETDVFTDVEINRTATAQQ